jgi:transketolase
MSQSQIDLDALCVNTIRTLSIDAVQAANSGHPGAAMAMAPVAYELWQQFLRFDPADPAWPYRDRFVLSAGHASMLLYSLLHLGGVRAVDANHRPLDLPSVSLDDIRSFRQLGSKCPGHPEYRLTPGVETTTGPLGQGYAASVGMAIAGRWLAAHYNRPDFPLFDHDVYALGGDGCMMEGISSEAASLAGHLRLSNLCWIYDSNRITIEGSTDLAFDEDVAARFRAYRWRVLRVPDANDLAALRAAFAEFRDTRGLPTLVIVDSHIGYGSPHKQDTSAAHGEPLGEDEVRLAKRSYGWPEDAHFLVPDGVREHFAAGLGARGMALRQGWSGMFEAYRQLHPDLAEEIEQMQGGRLPQGWDRDLPVFPPDPRGMAGREASAVVQNAVARKIPWLIGGSADLAPSTKTRLTFEEAGDLTAASPGGRNLHFGVREHAMGAILNGLAHGRVRPFGSTFLVFSDYMRTPVRLSAMMENPVILVFTHDSIGVGEDGPTHQPVEQLACLRAIPGLVTLRPADANEISEAWRLILELKERPVALVLSRQAIPTLDRTRFAPAAGLRLGAYILADCAGGNPDLLLLATGSEVSLCIQAWERLGQQGIQARVVSMPSWELFEEQDAGYRERVLPPRTRARLAVEQASPQGWSRYVGLEGRCIGMESFGASAPLPALREHFGFTPERIVAAARELLAGR